MKQKKNLQRTKQKDFQNSSIDMTAERIIAPQDTSDWCGVACMQEVIRRKKKFIYAQPDLASFLGTNHNGTSIEQMINGAKRLGLEAKVSIGMPFKSLKKEMKEGYIPIINWMSGHDLHNDGHYSILEIVNKKTISLNDPDGLVGSLRTFLKKDFNKVWFDYDEHDKKIEKVAILIK